MPMLSVKPARSFLKVGESADIDCTSSDGHDVPVSWERTDGKPLPYNVSEF